MGRVIKGSTANPERYTVAIPALAVPAQVRDESVEAIGDDELFRPFDELSEPAPPPEPEIDFEAIAAQAQALIDDAARTAETLVADAHERSRALEAEVAERAEKLAADARADGQRAGYAAGHAAARDEASELLATIRDLVESTRAERHVLLTASEPELVRLALGIAERVLHQQVALDGGVVIEMAKAAISRIVEREKITVRVNPADVDRMREHRDELLALGDVKTMQVIEDQRVDRGGVVIETDGGSIDAKISTQLAEVRKILHIVDDVVVQPAPLPLASDDALQAARAS